MNKFEGVMPYLLIIGVWVYLAMHSDSINDRLAALEENYSIKQEKTE